MARDLRQYSERLGFLMNSMVYEGLTEDLKQFLQRTGEPVEEVINHPIQRYNGQTAVHLAASNGLWECLEILLKNGGNPNAFSSPTDLCQTALHLAATKGYARCLQILLEHGAWMDTENIHRVTALDLIRGKKQCEKVFQNAIARVHIPSRTGEQQQRVMELHQLVEESENLVEFYHQYETLPDAHMDLATRWTDCIKKEAPFPGLSPTLLKYEKQEPGKISLGTRQSKRACAVECFDIVQFMLTKSENQPLYNFHTKDTPLHMICKKSNHAIAEVLLKHSPRMLFLRDARKRTPLHIACSRGDVTMVLLILDSLQCMLSRGEYAEDDEMTLDFRDALGRTPFFNACYYGFTDVIRLLVNFQAENSMLVLMNVNAALSNTQRTPLHAAVRKGSTDIVQLLLTLKDITIDAEARPSDKTHKRIIHLYQRKLHGRVIPGQDSMDDDRVTSSSNPSTPVFGRSTVATRNTPPILTSLSSSGALDEGLGRYMKSPTKRRPERHATVRERWSADESRSPVERNAFTVTFPRPLPRSGGVTGMGEMKKRSTTDTPELGLGDTTIGVFELRPNGKLEVKPLNQGTMLKGFKDFFVTPLAEACAYGYVEIMSLLLKYGAQDETGLACRIAHLVQRSDLISLILSHHCFMAERRTELRRTANSTFGLQLLWSNKNLPCVDGEWLKGHTIYYPPSHREDNEGGDTGYSSTKNVQQQRQRCLSSRAEVNTTAITVIHLEQNSLDSVPIELFCLPNVVEVDLSNNRLTKLPELQGYNSWECVQLEEINLNHNLLVMLPSCIWTLPGLIKLSVSHNKLVSLLPDRGREINDKMLSFTLESIDFSHNQLKVLPRFVFELQSLKRVTLHHNSLDTLPETLWSCITLQELIVSNNLLTSLPWCKPEHTIIASLTKAGTGHPDMIRQSERALTGTVELPDRIVSFTQQPSHVTLQGIRPLGTRGYDYSSLYKLNISNNKLDTFPEFLPCLAPNLTEIDISKNTFKHIDIQFIPQSIKKFSAKNCQIERFGNIIGKDLYVQVVKNCRHGKTFGLPCQHRSHLQLPCLTTLNLVGNRIQYFQLIYHLPLDEETQDHGKDESKFQVKVSSLELLYPALEGLDLMSNNLQEEFNPNIGHQSHLKWIRLSRNHNLLKVPMEFTYLKNTRQFTELSMEDLPNLWEPPKEYQSVSLTHLLTYMRSRLKESVYYRTIKLFFIGNGEVGKTTLLRRLRSMPDEQSERTKGLDIEDWYYPDTKKLFRAQRTPVHFIAWDFAGEQCRHTAHQCFYSQRSLYIALFRLTDGMKGVDELEPWLRNVQLCAPGCPVILVGTRLDQVSEQAARELEKAAFEKYDDTSIYPKVISVVGVSSIRRASLFFNNNMEKLRNLIYNVACHLQLSTDGSALEYKPDMPENDPTALFQQQIPKNFLSLQDRLQEFIAGSVVRGTPPIMDEGIFKENFKDIFENDDELNEAVVCLHLQGTLLHFEDHALKDLYFLDPQWLAKLIADVIHPSEEGSAISNGVATISQLSRYYNFPPALTKKYIHFLEMSEVAWKIDCQNVIIPSHLPGSALYPETNDVLSDITVSVVDQPTLRRFWLSNYIPDEFWPWLMRQIATDQNIRKLLSAVIGDNTKFESATRCDEEGLQDQEILKWIPWKTGIAFAHRGKTLLVVKQESNLREGGDDLQLTWLEGTYRVEVHVYTPEWVTLATELLECDQINYSLDAIPGLATKLLVMISQHVKSLASNWFPGMLTSYYGHPSEFSTYMPCWKCYAEIGTAVFQDGVTQLLMGVYISKNQNPVHCFIFEDITVTAAQQKELDCPLHNKIKVEHVAPDLIPLPVYTPKQRSTGNLGTVIPQASNCEGSEPRNSSPPSDRTHPTVMQETSHSHQPPSDVYSQQLTAEGFGPASIRQKGKFHQAGFMKEQQLELAESKKIAAAEKILEENVRLNQVNVNLTGELEDYRTQTKRLLTDLQQKEDEITQEIARLETIGQQQLQQLSQQERQLDGIRFEKTEIELQNKQLHIQCNQQQKELEEVRVDKTEIEQQNKQLQIQCNQQQEELEEVRVDKTEIEQQKQQLQTQQQTQLDGMEQRLHQLQQSLDAANREIHRLCSQPQPSTGTREIEFWQVSAQDIEVLEHKVLGRGGWGYVAEGKFRGQKVAVKRVYPDILRPNTIGRVHREISTMAQVRHPNLVLFIAAVLDERNGPMIITEILDTNLRKAYEDKRLDSQGQKLRIYHDVASALNYLHCHREPIIHRDLSAPNVLLEAMANNRWKAKISDFGSANLVRLATTPGEGAIVYTAPEAFPQLPNSPQPQGPEVDVYSYGILLCEVTVEQFPDPDNFQDMLWEVSTQWPRIFNLINGCTDKSPDERPPMEYILGQLDEAIPQTN